MFHVFALVLVILCFITQFAKVLVGKVDNTSLRFYDFIYIYIYIWTAFQKRVVSERFLKEVSYSHQGSIYLIK